MFIQCKLCGLLTSPSQHRPGCREASNEIFSTMSESTRSEELQFHTRQSNEDLLFAGTLRDWCDPLLQGQAPVTLPLCPRCAGCRCESVKGLKRSASGEIHEPSCPTLNHHHHNQHHHNQPHQRSKTSVARRPTKSKRRTNSYDPVQANGYSSVGFKSDADNLSSSSSLTADMHQQKSSKSKIPVRLSAGSSSTATTPASEYSSTSSMIESKLKSRKTRIPRPISKSKCPSTLIDKSPASIKSNTDDDVEDYDLDSLNGDSQRSRTSKSANRIKEFVSSPTENKTHSTMISLYCTAETSSTTQFNTMDEHLDSKAAQSYTETSSSSSEKRTRRFWQKEGGRQSKSKTRLSSNTVNNVVQDLPSPTSSSSSSSESSQSKRIRPYRLASPPASNTKKPSSDRSFLSEDSLSEKSKRNSSKTRPYSAFVTQAEHDIVNNFFPMSPTSSTSPSIYLFEIKTDENHPDNFGLSKTITYVWKSTDEANRKPFPNYSVEQIPPVQSDQHRRNSINASRQVTLQRGKIDCWQNLSTSPDLILTSSCQNNIGSASNLFAFENDQQPMTSSNGRVISISSITNCQPSLLSRTSKTSWNVDSNGKSSRYSALKWLSVDQLSNNDRRPSKNRLKLQQQQQQQIYDSATDTASSTEQNHRSAPPVLQRQSLQQRNQRDDQSLTTQQNQHVSEKTVPDYSLFHREINETSSPIHKSLQTTNEEPDESFEVQTTKDHTPMSKVQLETIQTPSPNQKSNSYASTDEDVDDLNVEYSEDIDRSLTTVQSYRQRLSERLLNEHDQQQQNQSTEPQMTLTEHSQITLDSGVDIISERKRFSTKIDEVMVTNQNDLIMNSDDSLLDIESSPHANLQVPAIIEEQSRSFQDESEGKSYSTAIADEFNQGKSERGPSNTSEQYYSAESEFNNTLSFINNDPLIIDESDKDLIEGSKQQMMTNQPSTQMQSSQIGSFSDWIDQVFTEFLSDTNAQSALSSRSSSIISMQASSHNTIDSSSSQVLTVIERSCPHISETVEETMNDLCTTVEYYETRNRLSDDGPYIEEILSPVSNNEVNEEADDQYENKRSLTVAETSENDEEVIEDKTMENNNPLHNSTRISTRNHEQSDDDRRFVSAILSTSMTNDQTENIQEENHYDEKNNQLEFNFDKRKFDETHSNHDNNLFSTMKIPDDSFPNSFNEQMIHINGTPQISIHRDSHDSLLHGDQEILIQINTATSSTDDLSIVTHHLSSSAFHSKDSALGLSDDNLNCLPTNPLITTLEDDNEHQISSLSLTIPSSQTIDYDDIQTTTNQFSYLIDQTVDYNGDELLSMSPMIAVSDAVPLSYLTPNVERTASSSSSEQLIPKEKQSGMYYPAFGSSAAIQLAEKYQCEWIQDVTPTSSISNGRDIPREHFENRSRIVHQHQMIGDDDEFFLSPQMLMPSYSCPDLDHAVIREPIRERAHSLTALDDYRRLDITRETLEQIWMSLLDVAFSDKDDFELGEFKMRHIIGLSSSYSNMNQRQMEKSHSHGDLFSSTNKTNNSKLTTKKSKSFDITSLPKSNDSSNDNESANVGLLQGAAISEPFVDRLPLTSIHSDTEPNGIDMDNDSIQSIEGDPLPIDEPTSGLNQTYSSVIKEPLNYVFQYNHQPDDDEYDLPTVDPLDYSFDPSSLIHDAMGEEDQILCQSLGFDDEETSAAQAAAAAANIVKGRDVYAELAVFRPHSLSTIASSGAFEHDSTSEDTDADEDYFQRSRRETISIEREISTNDRSDDDQGEFGSEFSSPQSRPLSSLQSSTTTPPENHQISTHHLPEIDHDAWARSIGESIYANGLSVERKENDDQFSLENVQVPIRRFERIEQFSFAKLEPIGDSSDPSDNLLIDLQYEQLDNEDMSKRENLLEPASAQKDVRSSNSTRTSNSSIHDMQLDPNELAFRLSRLDSQDISLSPKKTLADELAELGETHPRMFDNDSLDHSPRPEQNPTDSIEHLTKIFGDIHEVIQAKATSELEKIVEDVYAKKNNRNITEVVDFHHRSSIDNLTRIVSDIQEAIQARATSELEKIVEDVYAKKNNRNITEVVDFHHRSSNENLTTVVQQMLHIPLRPKRPTHLSLDFDDETAPVPSNVIEDLENQFLQYREKTPSPKITKAKPESLTTFTTSRPMTQRIDKVSDLEIMKQGNGFKIGYFDRQGTDQRVILTKRIEAGPDVMARDPHTRLPFKGRKILQQFCSSVIYTNGTNTIQEDRKFQRHTHDIEVPMIGTNPKHFDESDMVSIDIDGPSTMLNSICESIVITQGSVYTNTPPKQLTTKPISQPVSRNIFDKNGSDYRHVVIDQHEEYLLDSSRTPTPPAKKKDKVEVIDTWRDQTVIEGSGTVWRSPALQSQHVKKQIQASIKAEQIPSAGEPKIVESRIAPSHEIKHRVSEQFQVPTTFDWDQSNAQTPVRQTKNTRDIALSPILIDQNRPSTNTSSTSPVPFPKSNRVDRSCQYSPPATKEFALQYSPPHTSASTQVRSFEIPNLFQTLPGTQTVEEFSFVPATNTSKLRSVSPSLSNGSSDHQLTQPFVLSGPDYGRKLSDSHEKLSSILTVTQFTDNHHYLAASDQDQSGSSARSATLERSADSGILVDDHHQRKLRNRNTTANFALQVDIKGSSSDSEDVSEVTQRPLHRRKSSTNDDVYEHHSELLIPTGHVLSQHNRNPTVDRRYDSTNAISSKDLEYEITQLRRERAHIIDLLSLNWNRSNIWVELTEAKLNYIIGETDALLRSLSFDSSPIDSETVKMKMHQYEEDMAELTRQRLAVYRERLEDSKKQLDMKINELEYRKSTIQHQPAHGNDSASNYASLQYTPRSNPRHGKSFLSTSVENLSQASNDEPLMNHPQLLDVSFLTSTPANGLPPRYPRSNRYPISQMTTDLQRTVYRPAARYPTNVNVNSENRYDFPRYRTTSYITPNGNLSGMQGLSKSQQAILDETDKLVRDSQQFHNESASQFERARQTLISSETPIRLARANLAASRLSPKQNYLPADVTLAELFKYEQSLAKETAKNHRNYVNLSTAAES